MRITLFFLCALCPFLAYAESPEQRIDALERNLELLQRKLLAPSVPAPATTLPTAEAPTASFELRITALQEELRSLRGTVERLEHRQQQQEVELQKLLEDVDFRLQQIEATSVAPAAQETPAEPLMDAQSLPTPPKKGDSSKSDFPSARDHYNHAFKLLGSGDYAAAAESFNAFIAAYPEDGLIGNAYYWLGETHYVRGNYVKAAEMFRQGYTVLPDGRKAPDNLLKLAMSLAQVEKQKEACVILLKLNAKNDTMSDTVKRRAQAESDRLNCK